MRTSPAKPGDQYDSPWKTIIENHFDAFLGFFFPNIHKAIDWNRQPVFLDKEH